MWSVCIHLYKRLFVRRIHVSLFTQDLLLTSWHDRIQMHGISCSGLSCELENIHFESVEHDSSVRPKINST